MPPDSKGDYEVGYGKPPRETPPQLLRRGRSAERPNFGPVRAGRRLWYSHLSRVLIAGYRFGQGA